MLEAGSLKSGVVIRAGNSILLKDTRLFLVNIHHRSKDVTAVVT
jgi:hypothetical protein